MKRLLLVIFVIAFFFGYSKDAHAVLITLQDNGEVSVNVLAAEDGIELEIPEKKQVEVENLVNEEKAAQVTLSKTGDTLAVNVVGNGNDKTLDVTNYKDNIIEIVERPEVERMFISVIGDKFVIKQNGIVVETDYEININPNDAGVTVKTPSGYKFLSVNPKTAVDTFLRTKLVSRLSFDKRVALTEQDNELAYEIEGDKVFNFFGLVEYDVPVRTKISASTGELLAIDEPTWLGKIFSILV